MGQRRRSSTILQRRVEETHGDGRGLRTKNNTADSGQSTVEFALVLPLVLILLLVIIQFGLMLRDQLMVAGAARESAREAAVTDDFQRIRAAGQRAAPGLTLEVDVARGRERGDSVTVKVAAKPVKVPVIGGIVADRTLRAQATMRVEQASTK